MKKIITILLAVLLVAGICITAAAAGRHNFTDADNNGICDNKATSAVTCPKNSAVGVERKNGHCTNIYMDANNDGICDNKGNNNGNSVDANTDGICDNKNENCNNNFTDTDKDGVCDNRNENTVHHGNGKGAGNCRKACK